MLYIVFSKKIKFRMPSHAMIKFIHHIIILILSKHLIHHADGQQIEIQYGGQLIAVF